MSHPSSKATTLLLFLGLLSTSTSVVVEALTLPNLIGAISHHNRRQHAYSQRRRQLQQQPNKNGGNQMHTTNSITLTIDDDDPSGLWNVMSQRQQQQRQRRAGQQQQQQRRFIRFGFNFFQVNRTAASSSNNDDANHPDISIATSQSRRQQLPREVHHSLLLRPHGPVPQGGTLEDLIVLPSSTTSSSSAVATIMTTSSSSVDNNNSRMNKQQQGLWSNVRSTMRGIRHTIIQSTVSTFSHDDSHNHRQDNMNNNGDNNMMMMMYNNLFDRHGDGAAVNNRSVLRVGGMIHRHLLRSRRESKKVHQDVRGGYYDDNDDDVIMETSSGRVYINKANVVTAAARGGGEDASSSVTTTTLPSSSSTSSVKTSHTTSTDETTFIIETPLFPIILPKAWEAPFKGTSSYSSLTKKSSSTSSTTTSTTTPSSSLSYMESLEITIAPPEDTTSTTIGTKQPTPHQLQSATLPLIPKSTWESFTGNEFFHPDTYDGLVSTGVLMGSTVMSEEYVNWSGDKKTDKFIKEHNNNGNNNDGNGSNDNNDNNKSSSWYEALDSSQEVLVWSGKFIGGNDLYGAELPIIKTTSIIHKSPKYLAELLMDSTKVKAYNKMSLGREDVEVFQSGVDTTVDEGKFGNAGESKIVRNLTRPPMVNSNLEFVTCMHARKLSQQDLQTLSSNNNDPNQPTDGYIVVSRAVTGGQWNSDDSKNVRNEIILGVNILRQVPNEPDKTELIAVTHVYSPMIPLMLAKNAGVKGAVDFVRDIRSLP
ncbi:hypothetical protein ACHAWT_008488 [Skeletonema menzelii]